MMMGSQGKFKRARYGCTLVGIGWQEQEQHIWSQQLQDYILVPILGVFLVLQGLLMVDICCRLALDQSEHGSWCAMLTLMDHFESDWFVKWFGVLLHDKSHRKWLCWPSVVDKVESSESWSFILTVVMVSSSLSLVGSGCDSQLNWWSGRNAGSYVIQWLPEEEWGWYLFLGMESCSSS